MTTLTAYLLSAMIAWSPLSHHLYAEGAPVTEARYLQIASDVADAVYDEEPLFAGELGRERTAVYLLAVASYESGGFRADVQWCTGKGVGDSGHAFGLFQSHAGRDAVCGSIRDAVHVAVLQMRESMRACHDLPAAERLSGYAAGDCEHGRAASRRRVTRATRYWAEHPYTQPTHTTAGE